MGIESLVDDIYQLFSEKKHVADEGNVRKFGERLSAKIAARLSEDRSGATALRLSSIGQPCQRKLWYQVNRPDASEPLTPNTKIKFLFGDILEELLAFLTVEAGHTLEGEQDELDINGVKGHRDGVVDGRLIDFKSASSRSFDKFQKHQLDFDDPFGYRSQLFSYLHASSSDPVVKEHDVASFIAIDKQHGHITLDTYAKPPDLKFDDLVAERTEMVNQPHPPERGYADVPEGKSGNRKLGTACSYCPFKSTCWPNLRTFVYASGPTFLTHVEREPKVVEYIA